MIRLTQPEFEISFKENPLKLTLNAKTAKVN